MHIKNYTIALAAIILFSTVVCGASASPEVKVCNLLMAIGSTLATIGPTLVLLMFTYGGVKYVFSADDPGGRKQGKSICIHALIGGLIIGLAVNIVSLVVTGGCPTT